MSPCRSPLPHVLKGCTVAVAIGVILVVAELRVLADAAPIRHQLVRPIRSHATREWRLSSMTPRSQVGPRISSQDAAHAMLNLIVPTSTAIPVARCTGAGLEPFNALRLTSLVALAGAMLCFCRWLQQQMRRHEVAAAFLHVGPRWVRFYPAGGRVLLDAAFLASHNTNAQHLGCTRRVVTLPTHSDYMAMASTVGFGWPWEGALKACPCHPPWLPAGAPLSPMVVTQDDTDDGLPASHPDHPYQRLIAEVHDPYGCIGVWPSAFVASERLATVARRMPDLRVLEIGAGAGLPSLAALRLGAVHVTATDLEGLPLQFLRAAAGGSEGGARCG